MDGIRGERRRAVSFDEDEPLRLLIVEDDVHYRAYVGVLAVRAGFAVDAVGDAEAALTALSGGSVDVAIIDQELPRMSGIDLVKRLREGERTQSIYALMLTGHAEVETKLAALNGGLDAFIAKASSEAEIFAELVAAKRIAARQRTMDVTIRELYGLATRDELTGLFNRRFFLSEVGRLLADGTAVDLVLFDLDEFKNVNDTYGHIIGDRVLRDLGAMFHRSTRPTDIVARIGGDEFVMAALNIGLTDADIVAARLTREIRALRWNIAGAAFSLGVSTGVATSRLLADPTLADLLEAADRDMYRNKFLRRNAETPSQIAGGIRVRPDDRPRRADSPARPQPRESEERPRP